MAEDFFGSPAEAIGKTIRCQNKTDFKITIVFDDVPQNSTAQFDYILNWQSFLENNSWAKDWTDLRVISCCVRKRNQKHLRVRSYGFLITTIKNKPLMITSGLELNGIVMFIFIPTLTRTEISQVAEFSMCDFSALFRFHFT